MIGFGAAVPQPARSHAYASQTPSLGSAQGLLLARAGSPLARQDSHLLDDRQSFMEASHPPIPFDQPCLGALNFLSSFLASTYSHEEPAPYCGRGRPKNPIRCPNFFHVALFADQDYGHDHSSESAPAGRTEIVREEMGRR